MMTFAYVAALLALAVSIAFRRSAPLRLPHVPGGGRLAPALGAMLAAAYYLQTRVLALDSASPHNVAFVRVLPVRFFGLPPSAAATNEVLVLALVQTLALVAFVAATAALSQRAAVTLICAASFALGTIALASPSADSQDPYFYTGCGLLGSRAYDPPPVPFAPEFAPINRIWGTPMLSCTYGPLFVALARAVVALAPTLASSVLAFRLVGAVSLLGCVALGRALGFDRTLMAALACNPALYDMYVSSAHNDLLAVDAALGALLLARRGYALPAALLAASAGLVKLTVTLAALCAAAAIAGLRARVGFAVATLALVAGGYALLGGRAFVASVHRAAALTPHTFRGAEPLFEAAAAAVAVVAVLLAVAGRTLPGASWSFATIGEYVNAQYLAWGLPVAASSPAVTAVFLLTLPLTSYLIEPFYDSTALYELLRGTVIAALAIAVAYGVRPVRRPARP